MGHWFKHDSNASEDEKLLTLKAIHGKAGLCDWWTLCEVLASKLDAKYPKKYILGLTKKLELTQEQLDTFIKDLLSLDLLVEENGFLFSRSMVARLEEYEATKERNRNKKRGQRGDIEGTSQGQVSEIEGDASNSYSISNSRSESNNKKEEGAEVMHGRQCYEGNVWLSEEETELAKMRLSQNGLEHSDFDEAVRTLSDYLRGENNRFSKDKHFSLLVGKININSLLANKRQKDLNKRTNDPPVNKITFTELEKQARDKEEEERARRVQALMIRKQKELAGNASH